MNPTCDVINCRIWKFSKIFYFLFRQKQQCIWQMAFSVLIGAIPQLFSHIYQVEVKWSLNIKHATSLNFVNSWHRNFQDSSKCPSQLEEHFVYWQLFSIFNRYGDISKRRPPPPSLHSLKVVCYNYRKHSMSREWIHNDFLGDLQQEVKAEILTRDTS